MEITIFNTHNNFIIIYYDKQNYKIYSINFLALNFGNKISSNNVDLQQHNPGYFSPSNITNFHHKILQYIILEEALKMYETEILGRKMVQIYAGSW